MKRLFAFALGLAFLAPMFLVGCGEDKPADKPADSKPADKAKTE